MKLLRNNIIKSKKAASKSPDKKSKNKINNQFDQINDESITLKEALHINTFDERIVEVQPRKILSRSYLSASKHHDDTSFSMWSNLHLGVGNIPQILSYHYFRPALKEKYKENSKCLMPNENEDLENLIDANREVYNFEIAPNEMVPTPQVHKSSTKIRRHPTAISRSNLDIFNKRFDWREAGQSLILPTIVKSVENANSTEMDYNDCSTQEGNLSYTN